MRFADGSDLAYEPSGLLSTATRIGPVGKVLRIGRVPDRPEPSPKEWGDAAVRYAQLLSGASPVKKGLYVIAGASSLDLVLVPDGIPGESTEFARSRDDRGHLAFVAEFFQEHWDSASDRLGDPPVEVGDLVSLEGQNEIGAVKLLRASRRGYIATVDFGGKREEYGANDLRRRDVDPRDPEFWITQPPAGADATARLLSFIKLRYPLDDFLYSFAATRTQFKAYQYLPALKLLRGSSGRLLIADEVGLGKTIEAGLIWAELDMRRPVRRALIVVPAVLRYKWEREMRTRFMRRLQLYDANDLRKFADDVRFGEDPGLAGIISIESLRSQEALLTDLLQIGATLDLLIIDEAHVLRNRGTRSNRMGEALAQLAEHVIFLSATPLNLRSADLFNLVSILDEGAFPTADVFEDQLAPNRVLNEASRLLAEPKSRSRREVLNVLRMLETLEQGKALVSRPDYALLEELLRQPEELTHADVVTARRLLGDLNTLGEILNRSRKVDVVKDKALRVVETVPVEFSTREWGVYRAIERYYLDKARRSGHPTGFLLQMPLRSAASCLPIALENMSSRAGFDPDEWRYEIEVDDAELLQEIDQVPCLAELDEDSKYDAFLERLLRARDEGLTQALVFTFFRGTVEYLQRRLTESGVSARYLHGGVPMADRERVIQDFRNGKFDVLVANQVGSEGLDFEFCNVLVNYDLPWNPMQVEQRIGRLDRIGQRHEKIFIFNMAVPGTIETDIIARLFVRIGIFENSIGDLEPIMADLIGAVERIAVNPSLTPAEREREVDRQALVVEQQRKTVEQIQESGGTLITPGRVDVEGLDGDAPTGGRYVGPGELARLVEWIVVAAGGRVAPRLGGGVWLTGSPKLAYEIATLRDPSLGSELGRGELTSRLRDGDPIPLEFGPEAAQDLGSVAGLGESPELVGAYHPLIRFAVEAIAAALERHEIRRFGSMRIGDSGRRALALVSVATLSGLSTTTEMWVTAIDPDMHREIVGFESDLMTALAEDRIAPLSGDAREPTVEHVRALKALEDDRFFDAQLERGAENRARIDARIVSLERTIRNKIDRLSETLYQQRERGVDKWIQHMNQVQLEKFERELGTVGNELRGRRELRVSRESMGVLYVEY